MAQPQHVTCVMRRPDGEMLIQERTNDDPDEPSKLVFPGTFIQPNEEPIEAAIRCAREECGIEVDRAWIHPLTQYQPYRRPLDAVFMILLPTKPTITIGEGDLMGFRPLRAIHREALGFDQNQLILSISDFLEQNALRY